MLHALLRGKLSEDVPEPQRLEDALTSTVVGTLVLVEAWDVLGRWLACGRGARGQPALRAAAHKSCEAWFWPGLVQAEPDVVVRLDGRLYVIEAKYDSGRHDGAPSAEDAVQENEPPVRDQLHRQYVSVEALRSGHGRGPDSLRAAAATCPATFVFLVEYVGGASHLFLLPSRAARAPAPRGGARHVLLFGHGDEVP